MRKNVKRHNYLVLFAILMALITVITGIKGINIAKYTVPTMGVIILIGAFNAFKFIFPANYLVYRIWRKTGVLSWEALKLYLNTNKSASEIEQEFFTKYKKNNS